MISSNALKSAGRGVSKLSFCPVRGWTKPSRAACRAWRGKSRMAAAGEVDPDLVGPPGGEAALEQAGAEAPGAADGVAGQRRLAAARDDGHPLAFARVAPDGALDGAFGGAGQTPDQREVGAVEVP